MPTASRTAVCSLTTPVGYSSGIDQPPNSANFAPSATCRSCSGEVEQVGSVGSCRPNLSQRPASGHVPARPSRVPRVTTYTLRSASPAKTRADAVVVGVVQHRRRAPSLAPGGEDVADGLRPQAPAAAGHPRLHRQGRRGPPRCPTAGTITSPLLVLVGLGDEADRPPRPYAARAGAAARAVTNAASVARRAAGRHPGAGARGDRGLRARRLHLHDVQEGHQHGATARRPTVVVLSPIARTGARRPPRSSGPRCSPPRSTATRDWVNLPANDLNPPAFADAVVAAAQGGRPRAAARPRSAIQVLGRGAARRGRLRRHPRPSAAARPRPPRMVKLT